MSEPELRLKFLKALRKALDVLIEELEVPTRREVVRELGDLAQYVDVTERPDEIVVMVKEGMPSKGYNRLVKTLGHLGFTSCDLKTFWYRKEGIA